MNIQYKIHVADAMKLLWMPTPERSSSLSLNEFSFCIYSVLTPYYSEETVYSKNDLEMENEDGVSVVYYLQKIFPGMSNWWALVVGLSYFLMLSVIYMAPHFRWVD